MKPPKVIEVALRSIKDGRPLGGLLVWLNTQALGQDYYRCHLGITDDAGIARLTGDELLRQFAEDQKLFPMDYNWSLEECDDQIVVGIEGGEVFRSHRTAAIGSELTNAAAKRLWNMANNDEVDSAQARVALAPNGKPVHIVLDVPGG
jgi:hypothetical protein